MTSGLIPADPDALGPYRLLGRLGGGGMGQVYLGRSPGGRLVAVKVIRPDLAADPKFRVRFAREVANARNVSGIFTAAVIDADTDGPVPWLATAYVPGPSLRDAVREAGPLPASSLLPLAAGLAEALAAIHAAGVVHRDLKPSNVLLAADGPRVIDFGISHAAEASTLTEPDAVMGSPGYMSPEQAQGLASGREGDVFSLGAVLAFAATGRCPFGDGPVTALVHRVATQPPDLRQVPDDLRPLLERCLAKLPDNRPSPRDLLAAWGEQAITRDWLPGSVADSLPSYEPAARAAALAAPQPAAAIPASHEVPQGQEPALPTIDVPPRSASAAPARQRRPAQSPRDARGSWRRRPWVLAAAALAVAGVIAVTATLSAGAQGRRPGDAASAPGAAGHGSSPASQPADPAQGPSKLPATHGTPTTPTASPSPDSEAARTPSAQPASTPGSTTPASRPSAGSSSAASQAAGSSAPAATPSPTSPVVTVSGATEHSCSYAPSPAPTPSDGTAGAVIDNKTAAEVDFYYLTGSGSQLVLTVPAGTVASAEPYVGATYELQRPDGSCIDEVTAGTSASVIVIS